MQKIGDSLRGRVSNFQERQAQAMASILKDPAIAAFIKDKQLDQATIERSLSKFNQYIQERAKFLSQSPDYLAKGYEPILVMNEGYADVSYRETKELLSQQELQAVQDRIRLINLPRSYRNLSLADVHLDDARRIAVFDQVMAFVKAYPQVTKGLYLYGDMGIGKSFLMAALAQELSKKKKASVTMLHYPTFVVDVKNAISSGSVKDQLDAVKQVPVLILDDIGAESSTSWVRDEVLQVILQHRMLEELPTFFTSNYSMADLERKFSQGKQGDETWQAKRVLERIRAVATELHLLGENRR